MNPHLSIGDRVTVLTGGLVLNASGTLQLGDVILDDGVIAGIGDHGAAGEPGGLDASDMIVAPGLIDVQINGGWGHDFTADPSSIAPVARHLPATGVTSFLPTIITASAKSRGAALEAIADYSGPPLAAQPLGLHLEGPAIAPSRNGAHNASRIASVAEIAGERWSADARVSMVTLAPELPGALELIARLAENGVVVAAGHTDCTSAQFTAGRGAGVSMVTHLFNAMRPFSHRDPGPIGAALADDSVFAGVICDGIHVDPVAVAMAWHALGPDRFVLVTDAMAALGVPAGELTLGGASVTVDETGVRTTDGVLAGSNLALDQAVRNLVSFSGCSAADALMAASSTPARLLGLDDRGTIARGRRADLVVFDQQLRPRCTVIGGRIAWKS